MATTATTVGSGQYTYEVHDDWAKLPGGWEMPAAAVTVDSHDRVYCFNRTADHPVVVFDRDGNSLLSWGEPGTGPGQFNLPHGVWIDRYGRVMVCDRENDRVQVFDQQGAFLHVWPTRLIGPAVFYVDAADIVYIPEHNGGLVSVLTLEGERLAQWGDPGFRSCHSVWGDSRGDLYLVRPGAWGRGRRVVKYVRVG